ncbi:MAG: TetR family transcriptional regulator [Pseudomonadota bacterium]|nr:TetR family transcriptional regulator [Pseudomonadota bacterium]
MVRRTKEDAAATRDSILDAAEQLFVQQGVSRTTLQHIASAAGVTRGAIYWHFDDKAVLFNAMMDRAKLPMRAALDELTASNGDDPLAELHQYCMRVLFETVNNPQARRVFEIAVLKMELVDELDAVRAQRTVHMAEWMALAEKRVTSAMERGQARRDVNPRMVALGMWVIIDGLIRNWLFDPQAFDLEEMGRALIAPQIAALRVR